MPIAFTAELLLGALATYETACASIIWLRNYGGGEIYGEEIYGIYEQDFDTVVGGDIVYMHEINKKHPIYPSNALVIGRGIDQVFYFNLAIVPEDGEYPIYEFFTGEKYADNFIEFLKRRILED